MYDPASNLDVLLRRIQNEGQMSDGDVVKLMSLTRQLIEKDKLQAEYDVLNFYCNWCFHTSLSRSNICFRMLESITDLFLTHGDNATMIVIEVSELLSMKKLRHQFIKLFKKAKLPTFLFDDLDTWKGIGSTILKEVVNKPIQFPSGKELSKNKTAYKIFQNIQAKAGRRPMLMARGLWLSDKREKVWWYVDTKPGVHIGGQLLFTETADDFGPVNHHERD